MAPPGGHRSPESAWHWESKHRLARWAYETSAGVALPDSPQLKAWREKYTGYPLAQLPPHVLMGDALGSVRYWHGPRRTQWARDWVRAWTQGSGTFATTSMEAQDVMSTLGDESLGTQASLEAAYRAGSAVAHELLANWPKYEKTTPGG